MTSHPTPSPQLTQAIHPVDLDAQAAAELNAILGLLGTRSSRHWSIQADGAAPVCITHARSPLVKPNTSSAPTALHSIVVYEGADPIPHSPLRLHRPFRVMPVFDLLRQLEELLDADSTGGLGDVAGPSFGALLKRLLTQPQEGALLQGQYTDGGTVWAEPARGVFDADAAALAQLKAHRLPTLVTYPATRVSGASPGRSFPIAELAWVSALAQAAKASPSSMADAAFSLLRWPPFGRFDMSQQHLKLAAELTHRPAALGPLAQAAGVDLAIAARFVAACLHADLVQATGALTPLAAPAQGANVLSGSEGADRGVLQKLFRGLRNKLGMPA